MPAASERHRRCVQCRYDLRGSTDRCPECGLAEPHPIEITEPVSFHRARATLEAGGLLIRSREPGGVFGTMAITLGGRPVPGVLWVDRPRMDEAYQRLNDAGIAIEADPIPIVDIEAPFCPTCDHEVATDREPICPACSTAFMWVDIEEGTRDGLLCRDCGYDLTGSASDSCPECGRVVVPEPPDDDAYPERAPFEEYAWALPVLGMIVLVIAAILNAKVNLQAALVWCAMTVVAILIWLRSRQKTG